jgi:Tfp pilus assembly protein PilN
MKPLLINFAPPSWYRSIAQIGSLYWLLAMLGLALCIGVVLTSLKLQRQNDAIAAALERGQISIGERLAPKPMPKAPPVPEAQARAINNAIGQMNLPWRDLFDALEEATPDTIALLALEPDAKKHRLKGIAEAKDSDNMIEYIRLLKEQSFFESVILTKHEISELDPNRPLRFQFEAQWLSEQKPNDGGVTR